MKLVPEDYTHIPENLTAVKSDSPDVLRIPNLQKILLKGEMPYWFGGVSGKCSDKLKAMIKSVINLSDFKDEEKENGVPIINCDDPNDFGNYTFIITTNVKLTP